MRIAEGIECSISIQTQVTGGLCVLCELRAFVILRRALCDLAMTGVVFVCLLQIAASPELNTAAAAAPRSSGTS
jgi:hypothetical protein